jgi:hypothetical protein|tara:strand:- start:559 stop:885 length:327 start_codon:yes stop_codon:yes gene_type:complete
MRSKGNAPTAAQKRWREAVRDLGSIISGEPAVIHHPVGATGKHNKVAIGHWWVIPLTDAEHKALHAGEKFGFHSRAIAEKGWFAAVLLSLDESIVPSHVYRAIMDYHK